MQRFPNNCITVLQGIKWTGSHKTLILLKNCCTGKISCQAVSTDHLENNYSAQHFELQGQSSTVNTLPTEYFWIKHIGFFLKQAQVGVNWCRYPQQSQSVLTSALRYNHRGRRDGQPSSDNMSDVSPKCTVWRGSTTQQVGKINLSQFKSYLQQSLYLPHKLILLVNLQPYVMY